MKVGVQPQVRPEALCDGHASPERSLDAKSTRLLQGPAPHLVDVRAKQRGAQLWIVGRVEGSVQATFRPRESKPQGIVVMFELKATRVVENELIGKWADLFSGTMAGGSRR